MDTLLVTISKIERYKKPNEDYIDENEIKFYRQEIPMNSVYDTNPELMREIIALCNDLTLKKE